VCVCICIYLIGALLGLAEAEGDEG
jgi:hypothetical protein